MSRENSQLAKIARLYYQEMLTLREIADRLHVSMATVSRGLSEARRRGIVEITIHDEMEDFRDLELDIERRFGLDECRVVASSDRADDVYRAMAKALGELLSRILRPGMLLGLSWGETLKSVGELMAPLARAQCDTIPILGAIGATETGIYPNAISKSYADKLGGQSHLVNAPAILDSRAIRDSIERESSFRPIRRSWARLDAVLLSVSGLDPAASISRYAILKRSALEKLERTGARCATNFIMLNAEGREVHSELTERLLRLGMDELLRVRYRIVLSFGEAKREALRAALSGRVASALLTDQETAAAILTQPDGRSQAASP